MPSNKKLLQAAAGAAGGDNLYVEDVFSTFLFTGNSSTLSINNGLDLSGEGGLVWLKGRNGVFYHKLYDTARGIQNGLSSNEHDPQSTNNQGMTAVTSTGFTLGTDPVGNTNPNNYNMASWSFRKAAGFFDIQTYSGNGTQGRTVAHNLSSVPKMIIIKATSEVRFWYVWHESFNNNDYIALNENYAKSWAGTHDYLRADPTSSTITLDSDPAVNGSGRDYVMYLFGDDAVFGEDGDEQICKMGTATLGGSGTGEVSINLGFEPQFVLLKTSAVSENWLLVDTMNGAPVFPSSQNYLSPNTSSANASYSFLNITSTGFNLANLGLNRTYIYMAIRRPMKEPSAGTEVYSPTAFTGNGSAVNISAGFPVDLAIPTKRTNTVYFNFRDRLRGPKETLQLQTRNAEYSNASVECQFDRQDGIRTNGTSLDTQYNANNQTSIIWQFKRAPKFFDMVHYVGNGSVRTINHNLKVTPEMIWVKCRDQNGSYWVVYDKTGTATDYMYLDSTNAQGAFTNYWNDTAPTSTVFTLGTGNGNDTNASSQNYIAYLFATLAGVSKVGTVSHSGTTNVDCGFSNGARFVLAKRTDASGDWYWWDSARGIIAGNDPYLLSNSTSAEVTNTDYIDPLASGFTLTSSFTAGTYIFLAIA